MAQPGRGHRAAKPPKQREGEGVSSSRFVSRRAWQGFRLAWPLFFPFQCLSLLKEEFQSDCNTTDAVVVFVPCLFVVPDVKLKVRFGASCFLDNHSYLRTSTSSSSFYEYKLNVWLSCTTSTVKMRLMRGWLALAVAACGVRAWLPTRHHPGSSRTRLFGSATTYVSVTLPSPGKKTA